MAEIRLIYCAGKNKRFDQMAYDAGFLLGARLPCTVYFRPFFADQEYKNPARAAYMAALAEHRPTMATVLDWEREEQLLEVLDWAEEAAQWAEDVIIIPKVIGGISCIPRTTGGKRVILGYSVPTAYGGTQLPVWSFAGWPVHLLGGSPHKQMELWRYLHGISEVISVDGNMTNLMATRYCQFWTPGNARYANDRYWPTLREADGGTWGQDAPHEAFRRSCVNIAQAWREMGPEPPEEEP